MAKRKRKKDRAIWLAALGAAAAVFVSCSPIAGRNFVVSDMTNDITKVQSNVLGAYLAGRVAHIRRDFDNAANYYKVAKDEGADYNTMLNQLYLLLASQGRIDEAAEYAQEVIDKGTPNTFAYMVIATQKMYQGEYAQVIRTMNLIKDPFYKSFISPMFNAWSYVGLGDKSKAFQ